MTRPDDVRRALAACRTSFLAIVGFSFCINLLALAAPIYLIQVYDHVLASRSLDTLAMLTLIVLAALAVLGMLDALRREILVQLGLWLDDRLQPTVLQAALQTALRNEQASAAQAWRDLATLRSFLSGNGALALLDAPWAPLFIIALFAVHPLVGLVGVISAVFLLALGIANEVATRAPLTRASGAWLKCQHRAEAMLRNAEVIGAMGMQDGAARLLRRDQSEAKAAQTVAGRRGAAIIALSKFSRSTVQIVIMCLATWLVIDQSLSPGSIFACSILLSRSLVPVENSISTWKSFTSARIGFRRLTAIAAAAPLPRPAMRMPRPEGALGVERVSFIPPGGPEPVLRRISFDLPPGEVLGVLGPSGAGKSTLGRLIAGSWAPTAGHVRLDGAEIAVWLASGGARYLGYLPQDIELFEGTVKDNIARLQDADPEDVIAAAKLVGMHETIMRMPDGYNTEIGEAGAKLSGGQRQRLGLARAFFGEPQLVVLDEPNASLDAAGEDALYRAIQHLKSCGTTVVVIAHRARLLTIADKLLVLRDGAVDAFGETAEVAERLNFGRKIAKAKQPRIAIAPKPPAEAQAS